jgi:hypothetical protein
MKDIYGGEKGDWILKNKWPHPHGWGQDPRPLSRWENTIWRGEKEDQVAF